MAEEELNPHRHIIYYSKGIYQKTGRMYDDVMTILKYTFPEEDVTFEKVIQVLAIIAFRAMSNQKNNVPDPKWGELQVVKPITAMDVFIEVFTFMWKARESIADECKPGGLDLAMQEIITQGLLVTIACHEYPEGELGKPSDKVQEKLLSRLYG